MNLSKEGSSLDATLAYDGRPAPPPSVAHDETVLAPLSLGHAPPSSIATTVDRTTVLPRVASAESGMPTLAYDEAPRYATVGELGEGGVGEVVKVQDNDIGRLVALKRLKSEIAGPPALARFVEEIRVIGQLEHPNIVPIHDVGVDAQGRHYFVMKYVHGETLESIIDKLRAGDADYHRRYGFERRVQIFMGVLEAIAFAHDKGFIHRDIKPANVMVGRFGEVMVMDWGIAKKIGAKDAPPLEGVVHAPSKLETQVGALIGTPAYMSPEQARGDGDLDVRSDIYSLNILFYELLTLDHPLSKKRTIEEAIHGVIHEPVPFAITVKSDHQPVVPADLGWFLKDGLAKERDKRFASVAAMIERLERRMSGDVPVQCPITFTKRSTSIVTRFADRHPFVCSLALFLLVIAVPAAFIARALL